MFINEDLIESIEATPDTVLTLVDGRKIVVADPTFEAAGTSLALRESQITQRDRGIEGLNLSGRPVVCKGGRRVKP